MRGHSPRKRSSRYARRLTCHDLGLTASTEPRASQAAHSRAVAATDRGASPLGGRLPAGRLLEGTVLTLLAGLAASLPVIASTVKGLGEGLTPTGDRAIIATRAYDVFSSHTPLVGQYSASTVLYSHIVHSLGPMLYWLIALPSRFGSATTPDVVIAAVNVLAIFATVALARRRGGVPLMLATAGTLALMCNSFSPETLHDIWNPSAGLLPFTLLLFVSWSLACGEYRLLPAGIVLASFAAQCELVFLLPSVGVLAVGVFGLLTHAAGRAKAWPWWIAALVAGLACWSAPIVNELTSHPGNLTLAAEAALSHGPTLGLTAGWRAVVHAIGIPPWWLQSPSNPFGRAGDVRSPASALATISCLVILCGLLIVGMAGLRRRRRDVPAAAMIGLLLCLSLAAVTSSNPTRPSLIPSLGYTLWFGSAAGMWVWLTIGWSIATLYGVRLRRPAPAGASRARALAGRAPAAGIALGLLAVLAVGTAVALGEGRDQDGDEYKPVKTVNAAIEHALGPSDRVVLVLGAHDFTAFDFRAAVVYDLRRRGIRVYDPAASVRLGSWYEPGKHNVDATVYVYDETRPPMHGRVIAKVSYGVRPHHTITVMVARARRASG